MTALQRRNRLLAGLTIATICAPAVPSRAQNTAEPRYEAGQIHCPDGSTRPFLAANGVPGPQVMRLLCEKIALPMLKPVPGQDAVAGHITCKDGTTRKFSGPSASELTVNMLCVTPPDDPEYDKALKAVEEAKNHDAHLRSALHGDLGVWEGLKATVEARSLDYLLHYPLVLIAAAALLLMGLGQVFRRR